MEINIKNLDSAEYSPMVLAKGALGSLRLCGFRRGRWWNNRCYLFPRVWLSMRRFHDTNQEGVGGILHMQETG
jgi:hypothetical protein